MGTHSKLPPTGSRHISARTGSSTSRDPSAKRSSRLRGTTRGSGSDTLACMVLSARATAEILRSSSWCFEMITYAVRSANLTPSSWPQTTDALLEDMGLQTMRSGGSFLTWPFKAVDVKEIEHLTEEREEKRVTTPVW